jgi:hypothetical protein
VKYHLDERDAAHVLALVNMAGFDAIVGGFDAKFAYWFIRPTQADPLITLVVALPNFPSYPSAHRILHFSSHRTSAHCAVAGAVAAEATRYLPLEAPRNSSNQLRTTCTCRPIVGSALIRMKVPSGLSVQLRG